MSNWPAADFLEGVSDHQREQYEIATQGNVGFLSGGPGTGKTRTSVSLIRAIEKQQGILAELIDDSLSHEERMNAIFDLRRSSSSAMIAVCAPTGKAATRSTEVMREAGLSLTATTIHRLLEVQGNGYETGKWDFFHNENEPLPYDYIICDEPSMIGTGLMASFVRAIKPGTKVLMAGDPYQLPPVEHGKPFKDMIDGGLPHGHLTEIWRFAGRIAHVCDAIKHGKPWNPSPRVDLTLPNPENFKQIEAVNAPQVIHQTMDMVDRLIGNGPGDASLRGLHPITDMQVIAPIKENSTVSVKALNMMLQERLNPALGRKSFHGFRIGDKILCTRNQSVLAYEEGMDLPISFAGRKLPRTSPKYQSSIKHYIANGDIGEILDGDMRQMIVKFTDRTVIFKPPYDHVVLAYAITGHKSQGSQWPVTISIIDDTTAGAMVCNRSYWYTVLSRASRLGITVGKEGVLRLHCKKIPLDNRVTFLRDGISSCLNGGSTPSNLQSANSP